MKEIKIEYRNRLPHIAPIGACFFVTFRLGDSLPQHIVRVLKDRLKLETQKLAREKPDGYKSKIYNLKKKYFNKYDHQLDDKP